MKERQLTPDQIRRFREHLIRDEKSAATVEKYLRDIRRFSDFLGMDSVSKERVLEYKQYLQGRYAVRSVNSMLVPLNGLFGFLGWTECRVKCLKQQKRIYSAEERELTRQEYRRLLETAKGNRQLHLVMQTICATGIRVSELRWFTVEAIQQGEVVVTSKAKTRVILLPGKLRKRLLEFARREKIRTGAVFLARNGKEINRSSVWAQMKRLCSRAGIKPGKVFPHNLRKLFARSFYSMEKDIAKLADILGHSSIDTTRIYIMSTGTEHRRKLERLGLLL